MDPISALGIAAAAVQFIDFGSKLVSRSKEIYQSSSGFSAEHVDLTETTNKMISLSQNLESTLQNSASQTLEFHESQLLEVCRQCLQISSELITAINKIRTQGGHRKWNSFEQAFKSIWSQGQLDKLRKRLDESRQQLIVHILVSLRYYRSQSCGRYS
jgi:6-phosphogluconate dehydrogenase